MNHSVMLRYTLCTAAALIVGCSATSWENSQPQQRQSQTVLNEQTAAVDLPRSKQGNPPFYEVYGVRYQPMVTSAGYSEQGVASWYGKKFHGRSTSSGERYDMHAMTAAHKTLPLPTNVRVTNLENGKSIIVRVNDRGPFVKNRLIDLSYAAATELDVITNGTALVEVTALTGSYRNPPTSQPAQAAVAGASSVELYLQVGAFGNSANAQKLADRLSNSGIDNVQVNESVGETPKLYRVRIGPVHSVAEYDELTREIAALQIAAGHLAVESAGQPARNSVSGG